MMQYEIYIRYPFASIKWSSISHISIIDNAKTIRFTYKFRDGWASWPINEVVDFKRLMDDIITADMAQRTTVIDVENYLVDQQVK